MRTVRLPLIAVAVAFAACNDTTSPPAVAAVVINPDSGTFLTADTIAFTAAVLDAAGHPVAGRTVVWSSSDPSIVAVGSAGVAVTHTAGTAWVRAAVDGMADSARLAVMARAASVALAPRGLTGVIHGALVLGATVRDSANQVVTDRPITWTSSDTAVAQVSAAGAVTLRTPGGVTITATAGGMTDTASFTVRTATLTAVVPSLYLSSCGIDSDSTAFCWGDDNGLGVLGLGSTLDHVSSPYAVAGGLHFQRVTAGDSFACGLTGDGAAYCWGYGPRGRMGNGSLANAVSPGAVSGGHTFASIAAGHSHACALTAAGVAYCWGDNSYGDGGSGTPNSALLVPAAVNTALTFTALAAGEYETCGIAADSSAYCWGYNGHGELGSGDTATSSTTPELVAGGYKFSALTVGSGYACGIAGGAAYCWGYNANGELGDSTQTWRTTPAAVAGGHTFTAISAGGNFGTGVTCGLVTGGAAYCWGLGSAGQRGDGGTTDVATWPQAVSGGHIFATISAGGMHACGLGLDGVAYCWGSNASGQLGTGQQSSSSTVPVAVVGHP